MRLAFAWKILFLLAVAAPAWSQVVPSATDRARANGGVGFGVSRFTPDYGSGSVYGYALWVDYSMGRFVPLLHKASLEIEARDMNIDRSSYERFIREDAAFGGVSYTFGTFGKWRPYGKYEIGLGNVDYYVKNNRRFNQSRTVQVFGGGADYKFSRSLWLRADYEYEYFTDFFLGIPQKPTHIPLKPQGVTVGFTYRFRR